MNYFHFISKEEGREAEATISPTITTRSKATRGGGSTAHRRINRGMPRGGSNARPTPIIWQGNKG